jgi:uncharacterized protein (TIGR02246 family)
MRKQHLSGLLLSVMLVFCFSMAPSATAASSEEEALQVFTDFTRAMNTGDFELVASLYWHSPKTSQFLDATGLPFLYQGWEAIENNLKPFFVYLKSSPGSNSFSMHHPQAVMLGDNGAVITGYHNWLSTDQATKAVTQTQIRVTLAVQRINGKWLITHEHASAFPVK